MKIVVFTLLLSGVALASTVPSIPFSDGSGTASGMFTFNTATNQVTSWNLVTTFLSGATNAYNSADTTAAPTVTVLTNFSGNEVLSFEENHPTERDEFDIVIACHGVPNCLTTAVPGSSFATTAGGTEPCGPPGTFCIQSGEQFNVPNVITSRFLAAGFITDPPGGTLTFMLTPTSPTPEPGTLLMLGSGVLGLAGVARRKLKL